MSRRRFGNVTWVGMLSLWWRTDLDQIERCISEVHEAIEERLRDFERYVSDEAERGNTDTRDESYEWNSHRHWEFSELFPQIVRHSMFLTAYALLEHTMLELCEALASERPHAVSRKDLQGKGVEQAVAYLKKVQGIAFPDQIAEWSRLKHYQEIRNALVHRDGRLPSQPKGEAAREFLETGQLGSVDRLRRVSLTLSGCQDMIRTMRRFLTQLFAAVGSSH
jgi:hypothetical protein